MATRVPETEAASLLSKRTRTREACGSCRRRKRKCVSKKGFLACTECLEYEYECSFIKTTNKSRKQEAANDIAVPASSSPLQAQPLNPRHSVVDSPIEQRPPNETAGPRRDISLFEPYKCRFVSANSAIAFPRCLGMDLDMTNPPRLHSYGWNTGVRPHNVEPMHGKLCQTVSLEQVKPAFAVYFETINRLYGLLDCEVFTQRCETYWQSGMFSIGFEATVCGVIALGFLFSKFDNSAIEKDMVEHAKLLLEPSAAPVTSEHIVAWILRVIYLRSTSRPFLSWTSICLTMHIIESIGLHREIHTLRFAVDGASRSFSDEELEGRRRIFWVASFLNQFLAAEYGRSKVYLENVTCRKPAARDGDSSSQLDSMVDILCTSTQQKTESELALNLQAGIEELSQIPDNLPAITLLKADICLCLCRMYKVTDKKYCPDLMELVVKMLRKSWTESKSLSQQKYPWWNVVSVPFNSVCFLLFLNTRQSISLLPEVMDTLAEVSNLWDTHLSREAVRTARLLVGRYVQTKHEDLTLLDSLVLNLDSPGAQTNEENSVTSYDHFFEGLDMDSMSWTQFFDSSIVY